MATATKPAFSISLLHPKYWPVWLGFGLLAVIVTILPYKLQLWLGRGLGQLSMHFAKSRVHVAHRNLELAFPEMGQQEREAIVVENFKNTGLALFETGIAWFWPDWRIKRHVVFGDTRELMELDANKKGVLVVCTHSLNLEITARAFSLFAPGYGVYRPHDNPAYDFIQTWGRTRCGNQMVDRKDVKGMLKILRGGGRLWYLPDHDYGNNHAVFVPFFAVPDACTTAGTGVLVDASKCAVITASSFRKGETYTLEIDPDISDQFPRKDTVGAATVMNQAIEKVILRGLDQWMWLHKRFKSMADPSQPRGIRYK
ncbi:Kdo(2)-lipid IV(A) acyltransferase [Vibrio vulnificus]|uniref:Kdo(2)-lipid IV(A) acyltransferase n=1 Tax=Vibrio vulnificus TaxID=672 RepID=UPI001CDBB3B8|nr:Kdo(2)-lipid IV(A) acyltransferase [Vibrio vulnificus]EIV8496177.1 LpxL/LpxP family Kdo(2)-lipid IV(A) lauroyl/palmitoleoyl acyltransferasee [Vibrio vulnificus]ELV8673007.1 LpxL/LpxP family Kdo(2)-lipid IV(A) lauroyl/palmitoleoyl acyltransferasee [Vibrio vulnificus]MCA3944109.1 LpxL/LpxP family Kdo(2)-lipid IV(A) lauroyl/palmitoleoyl acyltransferasee [Vibrio vulnificus]